MWRIQASYVWGLILICWSSRHLCPNNTVFCSICSKTSDTQHEHWTVTNLCFDPWHTLSSRFFDYSSAMFTKLLICLFSPCLIIHFFPIQYFVFGVKVCRRSLKSVPTYSISIGKYKLLIAKWNKMDSFSFLNNWVNMTEI